MEKDLINRERELERLKLDEEIEEKKMSISQKKAVEKEMKAKYGTNWKKILGVVGKLKPNKEALQDLYSFNPELRDMVRPPGSRRSKFEL